MSLVGCAKAAGVCVLLHRGGHGLSHGEVFESAQTDVRTGLTVGAPHHRIPIDAPRTQKAHMTTNAPRGRQTRRAEPRRPVANAITQLLIDHNELQQMFTAFENTRSVNNKRFLVQRICTTVVVHAQLKEEIFYPAVESVLPKATPEHTTMKALVAHIQSLEPVAELVDGPIQVLAQEVNEHVSDLNDGLFPRVKASDLDLEELGNRMARRKAELIAELA